jgi:hypothetical protein
MEPPVTNKRQMYEMLAAGKFGNTIPQWFDVKEWKRDPRSRHSMWGVRTLVPGGPCRLLCPRDEVEETCNLPEFQAAGVNISIMIDVITNVTLWADVYDSDTGLVVYGVENPERGGSWRKDMPSKGREWRGIEAKMLLRRKLDAGSLADVEASIERWPGHVIELSATERPVGIIPGRLAVVWEVRKY